MRRIAVYDSLPFDSVATSPSWVGWFHTWAGTSERAMAVIERGDGTIAQIGHEYVRFIDISQRS